MAIVGKDELLNSLQAKIGEDSSDDALKLIEDITDTLSDFESRIGDATDWKQKYEDNDAEWRKKYKERFFNPDPKEDDDEEDEPEPKLKTRFEDLFS